MRITGTIINYYFHCKRQCYLFANRINLEDNSEDVRIGRVIHEIKAKDNKNTEIKFENIAIDKITNDYIIEMKKSDSDILAARMQVVYYLKKLEEKGIHKKGKLVFNEKKTAEKVEVIELNEASNNELKECITAIEDLISKEHPPKVVEIKGCKKCAYYDYCYI